MSVLAGNSKSTTPGLIPDAEFYLASAFRTSTDGDAATDTETLLKALSWLAALDVQLVNMSFTGPRDPLIETAITQMHAQGVVFVAAVGNDGPGAPPSYPAAYPPVIAVTAVDKRMQGYRYANRGSYVDIAAPGVDIWAALPDGQQDYRTGTSFAAPFVTGIVATMQKSGASVNNKQELLKRLTYKDLGAPGRDPIYGEGLPVSPKSCGTAPSVADGRTPQTFSAEMPGDIAGSTVNAGPSYSWAPTGGSR